MFPFGSDLAMNPLEVTKEAFAICLRTTCTLFAYGKRLCIRYRIVLPITTKNS
jgi:hypothetical protein